MGRRIAVFGGSVALALAAAGCGTGSPSAAPKSNSDVLRVIQAAAATTAHQNSARIRGTLSMDLGAVTGTSTGAVTAELAGTMQTKPLAGRLTISGMQVAGRSVGDMTELITPDGFYMNMPTLSAQLGKPWIEMKFSEMKAAGLDFKQLMSQSQQMQPAQYLQQLAASGDVKVVGTETVNGFRTTHYAGTVGVEDQLAHFSGAVRSEMQGFIAKAGWTGAKIDIWIDDQGLVRRMHSTSVGGKGAMSIALDVLAYGVPVDVTPPPARSSISVSTPRPDRSARRSADPC
jgi:hypothetical protein